MRTKLVFLLTVLALFGACSEERQKNKPCITCSTSSDTCAQELEQLQVREAEILQKISNESCLVASNCAAIAFGTKPCGGPWKYLVYSKPNVNEQEVQRLVGEYNALEAGRNEHCAVSSDCPTVTTPRLSCPLNTLRCTAS